MGGWSNSFSPKLVNASNLQNPRGCNVQVCTLSSFWDKQFHIFRYQVQTGSMCAKSLYKMASTVEEDTIKAEGREEEKCSGNANPTRVRTSEPLKG